MALAEGTSASLRYKAYASGVMAANAKAVSATDPAVTGGKILRRVSSSLKLAKDTYQSAEIRTDQQIADFRHGVARVTGSINGEFSPGTYWDFLEAAMKATSAAGTAASNTDFTSVAADNPTSTFTFVSGDPVALGYRVGGILRFANLSDAGNNAKNFLITGFSGTSNRIVTVYPAPNTMGADSAFTMAVPGKTLSIPSTGFVARKFAIEKFFSDIDISELFTECRIAGFNIQLPATGMATIDFPMMGRDMEIYTGASAPFFTSPTAETATGIFAAVNGLLRVQGAVVGVVTGLTISNNRNPSADAVVGQNFPPEVFIGRNVITGQMTAELQDETFINYFKNETEIDILAYLTTTSAIGSPAVSIHLPRVKFGDADVPLQGEGAQTISLPFQALKYNGAAPGVEATTIRIVDTEAV